MRIWLGFVFLAKTQWGGIRAKSKEADARAGRGAFFHPTWAEHCSQQRASFLILLQLSQIHKAENNITLFWCEYI